MTVKKTTTKQRKIIFLKKTNTEPQKLQENPKHHYYRVSVSEKKRQNRDEISRNNIELK